MPLLSPSILNGNFLALGEDIKMLNSSKCDWIHLDIMDGNFVPNISFGFPIIEKIKSIAEKPLDVHLMINDPDRYLSDFRKAGADILTVHFETCVHLNRTVSKIRELGMKPSVCLNPHTPVSVLEEILPELFMVLIMSVNPGFGAQKFIETSHEKVAKLRAMIDKRGLDTLIELDGGVGPGNIRSLAKSGVDVFVAGNAIFSSDNPMAMIELLITEAGKGVHVI
jgi:ribulose-phosphate 3-epimerase